MINLNNNYLVYFFLNILSVLMLIVFVMVGVAFLTLLERKILGYIQYRKGPNKIGYKGIIQPFSDAMKLMSKEIFFIYKSVYYLYYMAPMISLLTMLFIWSMVPFFTNTYFLSYSILYVLVLTSIGSYSVLLMGWSSNSLYSMMGSMRSVAQMLSYEVSFFFIVLILMIMSESYSFLDFIGWQMYSWYFFIMFPLFMIFLLSVLAELNRSPMDFIEGESELVSGFNVEYFSGGFTLIFLAEYGMIMFMSYLMMLLFTSLGVSWAGSFMLFFNISMIIFMRGMLPRMRYDELMYLCWKMILPFILCYFMLIFGFKILLLVLMI